MTEDLNIRNGHVEEFYDISEKIGSGQFAVVKKLIEKSSGQTFAAKFIKKKRSHSLRRGMTSEQVLREASVLRSVNHTGIIYLHDIFETKLEFVLVLELLSGGELFEFLSEQEYLTEDEAVGFLKQAIEAIDYLHQGSIVHLDIKPENIVLKSEGSNQIKLIDFGLARKLTKGEMVREIMGTPEFVGPEIIAFEAVGTETDMWAVGVLTYIMLSGASPFLGDDDSETFNNIAHVDYKFDDEYFKDISSPAKEFISDLLLKDPRERMTAGECLKHEWMQEQNTSGESEEDDDFDGLAAVKTGKLKGEEKKRRSTLIKTEAFKKFTARARWQKSVNKLIAISRLAFLGKKNDPLLTKGVLLEPNMPVDTSSDNESNNQLQSIPLERLDYSARESTTESTNEEESVSSTDSAIPLKEEESVSSTDLAIPLNEEESLKITKSTENGVHDKRKNHEDEENESLHDGSSDEKEHNNRIIVPRSRASSDVNENRPKTKPREEQNPEMKLSGNRDNEKNLDMNESGIVEAFGKRPGNSYKNHQEKLVLTEEKSVQSVSKPTLNTAGTSIHEAASQRRQLKENTVDQTSPQPKRKESDISTEIKQEIMRPNRKLLFHSKSRELKAEPTTRRSGKLDSLISKFSNPFTSSEGNSNNNKYTKELRKLRGGSVGSTGNEDFQETRVRRKSDQTGSRVDSRVIRTERDERMKANSTKINQRQNNEATRRRSPSKVEVTTSEAFVRNASASVDKEEQTKSPKLKKASTETTVVASDTKAEIQKAVASSLLDEDVAKNNQDDSPTRRATTSEMKEKTRKDFPSSRRGVLGLRNTSAKAEVMKWEQRSKDIDSSGPKRSVLSPPITRSIKDRPFVMERRATVSPVHNTTLTVNRNDTSKTFSGKDVEIGAAINDREHTLLVQTSLPLQRAEKLESRSKEAKKGRDFDTKAKIQEYKVNRATEKTENTKHLVDIPPGKPRNVMKDPRRKPQKTEHSPINKREKIKSEVQTETKSSHDSMFPEFALTFRRILPAENDREDDDLVWIMTSETNPDIELLASVGAPKGNTFRKSSSSKNDSKGSRRRGSKPRETETEPTARVDRDGGSSKSNELETDPNVRMGSRRKISDSKSSVSETESSVDDSDNELLEEICEEDEGVEECEAERFSEQSSYSEVAAIRKKSVGVAGEKILEESEIAEKMMGFQDRNIFTQDTYRAKNLKTLHDLQKSDTKADEDKKLDEVKLADSPYFEYKELVTMIEDHLIIPFDVHITPLPYKETSV